MNFLEGYLWLLKKVYLGESVGSSSLFRRTSNLLKTFWNRDFCEQ